MSFSYKGFQAVTLKEDAEIFFSSSTHTLIVCSLERLRNVHLLLCSYLCSSL